MWTQTFTMMLQLFFIFTPFFVLSMFLTMTTELNSREKRILVLKTSLSVEVVCLILIFGGSAIFALFSITVDAFRIGAGAILFLSAVDLVQGKAAQSKTIDSRDISVVPLSIPIIVGPATTGTLMVMGAGLVSMEDYLAGFLAVTIAVVLLGLTLFVSPWLERVLKEKGISVLTRLSGLILSALSAQMAFTGIRNMLF
ncbi:MAG: NAAT family transporter [Spirochaetales bacterium]|nr:NAAT family transporter [Spirochaetales bacterium]